MLIFWWRKNAKSACDAPRNAVYEWKSWNGWNVKALLPAALHLEARLEHDAADVLRLLPATVRRFLSHLDLTDMSRFLAGRCALLCSRKAGRAIRHGFDYKVSPRPVKKPAHRSGWEFGAHDIIPHDQGDQFVIDANSTQGMGYAVEDGLAFLREPWERDPQ